MIKREHYLKQIRPFYDSDLIKVITGIRRCGKSIILEQIKNEISKTSTNVIYLNFEFIFKLPNIKNDVDLINYVNENRKPGKCYVFLDEIQTLQNWNLACKTLRLMDVSLFITGSNSKLLAKEFTKELSGRYVSFRVKPFIYKELIEYANELNKSYSIDDYLVYGGFPKILEFPSKEAMNLYLEELNNTIIINDILNRYKIKNETLFIKFTNYILKSNSRIFSINSILDYLKSENINCSYNTILKYVTYLENAYVINKINQYSPKTKKELSFYAKFYDEDVSFNSIRTSSTSYDITHNLENIVYNELIYMGYSLQVFNINNDEIDFLATKGNKQYLIQVTYTLVNESTRDREFKAFNKLDNSIAKIIISNDNYDFSTSTVKHIELKDFLLLEEL